MTVCIKCDIFASEQGHHTPINERNLCEYACVRVWMLMKMLAEAACRSLWVVMGSHPCTMKQRSNCVWRGWACLWDVPSWASEAVEEAAAAELVCCRPTIGQKCYSWEGLCKLGRSTSRCSIVDLESYRMCWLQPRYITRFDRNGLKQRRAPLWFPRPRVEIISHRLTNYLEAENKASTKTSHSQ